MKNKQTNNQPLNYYLVWDQFSIGVYGAIESEMLAAYEAERTLSFEPLSSRKVAEVISSELNHQAVTTFDNYIQELLSKEALEITLKGFQDLGNVDCSSNVQAFKL